MTNPIAIAREQKIFVTVESARGTLAAPADSGLIIAAGDGVINQKASYTNSSQVRDSRSVVNRFQDRTGPGDWSFPVYVSPAGAGVAPQEDVLMQCLFGTKTVNAATSVVYTLAKLKPSFSLWIKLGHTVYHASGATVGNAKAGLANKDGAKIEFSGQFMRMGWAGTATTAGTVSAAATTVLLGDDEAKRYTVGAKIEFVESGVAKNNADAGYTVTDVDVATHTLTFTPGAEEEITSGATVRGWLPDGTEAGTPLEARKGVASVDGSALAVRSMTVDINDQPEFLVEEITTSGFPENYSEGERQVNGNISFFFRQNDVGYFYDGQNNTERALTMTVGDTAGYIFELDMARCSLDVPAISRAGNQLALDMPYIAMGSDGEDEIVATYR